MNQADDMNVVFCVDRSVLPGLHVAAYSLLEQIHPTVEQTNFSVFSDELAEADLALLRQTLANLNKSFTLVLRRVNTAQLAGFPPLNGSLAAYYRLLAAQLMDVERFLYVDADTLCDVDLSELNGLDMGCAPAGLVPEAPMALAIDRFVALQMGNSPDEPYYNSGVILVNVAEWRRQRVTERAMEYIAAHRPPYHDQSALNVVLRGSAFTLDERFNCITNMRRHWSALRLPCGQTGRLLHFVDYPKPWNLFGEFVHPHYRLWRSALDKTALKGCRSWHAGPSRKFPASRKAWNGYKKALKDRLLFAGYSSGWLKKIKGVPFAASRSAVDRPAI
ncbi:MAG TPA: glycosyltransferase family 8 protein [Candidatus Cybelea sp.]|nr:glycosyltransferase family 8 protein [Candidatus Cybelea sp.]